MKRFTIQINAHKYGYLSLIIVQYYEFVLSNPEIFAISDLCIANMAIEFNRKIYAKYLSIPSDSKKKYKLSLKSKEVLILNEVLKADFMPKNEYHIAICNIFGDALHQQGIYNEIKF